MYWVCKKNWKVAWRPTPKWNTRLFFAFSKRIRKWENSFGKVENKVYAVGCLSLAKLFSKLNWDSQLIRLFPLPSQRNVPIFFKPKVAIAKFIAKMKVCYYKKWVGRHASFPPRRSVKQSLYKPSNVSSVEFQNFILGSKRHYFHFTEKNGSSN